MNCNENEKSGQPMQKKLGFHLKVLLAEENNGEEFQVEEIRARHYYAMYKTQQDKIEEIEELKKKLAEAEKFKVTALNSVSTQCTKSEIATNTTICEEKYLNEDKFVKRARATRDSLAHITNHATFNADYTTNDNFTCVTNISFGKTLANDDDENNLTDTINAHETFTSEKTNQKSYVSIASNSSALNPLSVSKESHVSMKLKENTQNESLFAKLNNIADATVSTSCYSEKTLCLTMKANEAGEFFERLADRTSTGTCSVNDLSKRSIKSNRNEEGSLYDLEKTDTDIKSGSKLLDDRKSIKDLTQINMPDFEITDPDLSQTMTFSKISDFNPHAASTMNLKPILNRMKEKNNKIQAIGEESSITIERSQEKPKNITIMDMDTDIDNNNKEKERKTLDDTNQLEKTMSKIIAEDFGTTTTNCVSKFKAKQEIQKLKAGLDESELKERSINCLEFTNKNMKNLTTNNFNWDDEFDQNESKVNLTCSYLQNYELIKPSAQNPISESNKQNINPNKTVNKTIISHEFTAEGLDTTFKEDYYKLVSINNSTTLTSQLCRTNVDEKKNLTELVVKEIDKFNNEKCEVENVNEISLNLKERDIKAINQSILDDLTILEDGNDLNTTTTTTGRLTSSNVSHLNETIVNAIRDPFSFDIKNRLLNKRALDYLKSKSSYVGHMVKAPVIREKGFVVLNDAETYKVLQEIGKGSYAKIYLIESQAKTRYALKVDSQSTAWEFYITEKLHERLRKLKESNLMKINVVDSFVQMHQFMKYNDGCFSAMNYYKNGTLLDLINFHVKRNENFPYWLVIYLTLEMLYIVDYLHKCKIIHSDIKPDNLLISQLPSSINYFDPSRTKCLVLIDFNRSIDLELLPGEAEFNAKVENKSLLCTEMKSNKSWKYQIDYFGILSSIHCIVFRKYMNWFNENGKNRIASSFPRNYDKLFSNLFDAFLNIPSCQDMPNLQAEWIDGFVGLFRQELQTNFCKYIKYLKELNDEFLN